MHFWLKCKNILLSSVFYQLRFCLSAVNRRIDYPIFNILSKNTWPTIKNLFSRFKTTWQTIKSLFSPCRVNGNTMQNDRYMHATRDVNVWAHLFSPTETVQTLTFGQNMNALVSFKYFRLRVAIWFLRRNICMPHAIWTFELTYFHPRKQYRHSLYMHATRDLNVWGHLFSPTKTV